MTKSINISNSTTLFLILFVASTLFVPCPLNGAAGAEPAAPATQAHPLLDKPDDQPAKTDDQEPVKQDGEPSEQSPNEEELRIFLEQQFLTQIHEVVIKNHLHAIYSKVEALTLMIGNNALKHLSYKEKELLVKHILTIRKTLEEHAQLFLTVDKKNVAGAIAFNKALLTYLIQAVKRSLKKLKPFTFSYTQPEKEPELEQLIGELKKVSLQLNEFERLFKNLGMTQYQKIMQKISFFKKYAAKAKLTAMAVFFACIARYLLKEPSHGPSSRNPSASQANNASPSSESQSNNAPPSSDNGFFAKLWNFIDDDVIGRRPKENQFNPFYLEPGTGQGFFGKTHEHWKSMALLASFPLLIKGANDAVVEGVNAWKGFYKDPKAFFKIRELFNNEKQTVSPIEELFLFNALEHSRPTKTFDDVAGLHEQKKELIPIINYLLNPELFEKTGTSIEKGYLLCGPTRTGKTYLAEALAGEIVLKHRKDLAFLKIKGGELRFVGIKKILNIVKKYAPCIVFIDELDLLNLQRDQNNTLLEEFLTAWKSDDSNKQVIFLAATNRIDHIDHALLQPGRFGKKIMFENPSYNDRKEFFKKELSRKTIFDPSLIDLDRLTKETENCSYGDLASIVNHALAKATQSKQMLSYTHFDSGIDVFKLKIVTAAMQLPDDERNVIALHLAGHALAYALLPTNEQLHKVTMMPIQKKITEEKIWLSELAFAKKITSFGDVFTLHKINTSGIDTPEHKMNKVKVLLAGHAAEKVVLGASAYNYHNDDYEQARQILEGLVFRGLKKEHFAKKIADAKLEEIAQLIKRYEDEVTSFLQERKDLIVKIAQALNNHLTLTGDEIEALIKEDTLNTAPAAS